MFAPEAHPVALAGTRTGPRAELGVEIFDHPSGFPADLTQFFEGAEQRNVEFGLPWYRNLVDTVYKEHPGVRFYVLRRDRRLIAVLPLRVETALADQHLYSLGNFYTTLYEPLLDAGARALELAHLLAALRRDFPGYGSLALAPKAVYRASWKKPEPFPRFMPGLLETYAEKGALRLGVAWLDGKPVAAQIWIVANGRAHIYKVAYHEDYKAYSPGTLVTAMLMEHALDVDRVHEVDYLIGDDPYKAAWMSARRERHGIVAYNPRSLPGLASLGYECCARLIKTARARWRQRTR